MRAARRAASRLARIAAGWNGDPAGTTVVEYAVALAIIGILLGLAIGWQGSITKRRLQNAAYLVEGDLRFTQQTAVSRAGGGPQAELCLRPDGYDIYPVVYQDPIGRTSPAAGGTIKRVNAGAEYANGVQLTPDASATSACTMDASRQAIVFLASGTPKFPDTSSHTVTVAVGGGSMRVTIQPTTGMTAVGP
ncbi:MAG TPA: type II secretion system protein [bacterium]|nr:type II secretion system protein [bacterium]